MRGRAWRLAPAVALAWGAAALATIAPAAAGVIAFVAWVCVGGAMIGAWRGRSRAWALLAVALAAAAAVCTHVAAAAPVRDAATSFASGDGRSLAIDARITGGVSAGPTGEVWFDAVTETVAARERMRRIAVPVRVGVDAEGAGALADADLGARITVRVRSIPPDPGDRAVLVLRATGEVRVAERPPGLLGALAHVRDALARSAADLPGDGAALVPGLATGDTSAVDASLDAAMTSASLSHLTAVSGANCAIVVALAFGAAAVCGLGRRTRIAGALGALALFVVLVTPEPSVVRAGVMAAVAMLALALGRTGAGLATLSLAVTVLLVLDPWLALSLGFALSVVATAALLVLARPLADGMSRGLPRPLALAIAVPLSAQLACAPLLVLVDPHVPLLGVVANLLSAPAAPMATIAGFLACLAAPVPVLQDGLVAVAWLPASWIGGVARTVSQVPAQQLPWLEGWPGMALLAVVCAALTAAIAAPRVAGRIGRGARGAAFVVAALVVGCVTAQVTLQTVAGGLTVPAAEWRVAMCDVGQGDATLVRSDAAVMLVDTGADPALLGRCLDRFGVDRIDVLVLTHFDLDHSGGADAVRGHVATVVHGPVDADGARTLAMLSAAGAQTVEARAGLAGVLGQARWRTLWPGGAHPAPGNDASIVVEVGGGDVPRTVLLGDLSAEPQARLLSLVADVEVVKVSHHGSADQDAALYDALEAEVALIGVGAENDYGHPRATLLAMLAADGSAIARTDRDGAIAVWREGGALRLWREHDVGAAQ